MTTLKDNKQSHFTNNEDRTSFTTLSTTSSLNHIPESPFSERRLKKRLWKAIFEGDFDKFVELEQQYLRSGESLCQLRINKYGWTPLHAACYFGRLDIASYLIEELDSDPNFQNPNGWHSLTFAVMGNNSPSLIEYLICKTKVDPNINDISGNKALYYAQSINPTSSSAQLLESYYERAQSSAC